MIKFLKELDEEWQKEPTFLRKLNHKNLVKYEDHFELITKEKYEKYPHPCILTEYCQVLYNSMII